MATNTTLAIVAATALAAGIGGTVLSTATTAVPRKEVHALDLRCDRSALKLPDGCNRITAEVWGDVHRSDGGWLDLGPGRACLLESKEDAACKARLFRSAASCLQIP